MDDMATTEMRMVRWAMGVSLLEHRRNEETLEEAKLEAIATVIDGGGWNGLDTSKEEVKLRTSEQ